MDRKDLRAAIAASYRERFAAHEELAEQADAYSPEHAAWARREAERLATIADTYTDPPPVDPNAWEVAELAHISTGQTIAPDEQTGDEWSIEWRNETVPAARVVMTFAVTRRPVDEEGNNLDTCEIEDVEAHPFWRYAVDEQTELLTTETPADFWVGPVDSVAIEYGDGSFRDYETEDDADEEAARMASDAASLSGVITWDGGPIPGR